MTKWPVQKQTHRTAQNTLNYKHNGHNYICVFFNFFYNLIHCKYTLPISTLLFRDMLHFLYSTCYSSCSQIVSPDIIDISSKQINLLRYLKSPLLFLTQVYEIDCSWKNAVGFFDLNFVIKTWSIDMR